MSQSFTNNDFRSSTDKDSVDSTKMPSGETQPKDEGSKLTMNTMDISAATFLDVAVLRCLFITHWQEEGIYWALHYMYNRYCFCGGAMISLN